MARSTERKQDDQPSVWSLDSGEPAPASPGWLATLTGWPRRGAAVGRAGAPRAAAPADRPGVEPSRGQALRQAHGALHDRLRTQRDLCRVLPHLHFIERSLARQGSAALQQIPVRVLQRGLQQLARLPADNLAERAQFSVLQQRLVEAIQARQTLRNPAARAPATPADSFVGGLDSGPAPLTGPGGLDVTELPHSAFDHLVHGDLTDDDDFPPGGGRVV